MNAIRYKIPALLESDSEFLSSNKNITKFWSNLFVENFVCTNKSQDDLLFFVRKQRKKGSKNYSQYETLIEVFRKESKKLPIGDLEIDWEETLYLNLIMQEVEYWITCAICTRTSFTDIQILKKRTIKVFASPSHRKMDRKGEVEEISYPNIFFSIDNFEDLLSEIVVRNGEMVTIELIAKERGIDRSIVLFMGSISYDLLTSIYDNRDNSTKNCPVSWKRRHKPKKLEFVRMRGPGNKGIAEIAIKKENAYNIETPTSDPGFSLTDFDFNEMEENYSRRRMSDPSSNLKNYIIEWRTRRLHKSRSESEGVDKYANGMTEVDAEELNPECDNDDQLWQTPGFIQAYYTWKENKRANSPSFQTYLTYITLPWHYIVADLLNSKQTPLLTF
ncbi:uncharacterized protein B4U79_09942 [Dinothrombium tinctorium]|uniref:Uncharacterized protein n=1 Tax=Dinothrombium tinctorium TaxID=1965070 RepID=A0A3S3NS83_9ACAR|nr:uncharacterized protein B4U79_09942 [Dinothrombium tinctorium]